MSNKHKKKKSTPQKSQKSHTPQKSQKPHMPQNPQNIQKSQNPQQPQGIYRISADTAKGWQPRAEITYKRIKNKVGSLCGAKQAAQYVKNARDKHLPLIGYFEHYYGERGAIWARSMVNAIYAQLIWQNYQISRRSIQFAPRPVVDLMRAMQTDKDAGRGASHCHLDDQCIFIDVSELGFETVQGDGIFLSIFNATSALYCCIHLGDYYCGEISLDLATSGNPYERPEKDLRHSPDLLKLVYLAWTLFGLLTGGLQLPNQDELIITQDLGEIRDHTPVRTIMSYAGYDTLPGEGTMYLNMLIKTMRWGSTGMADLLDQMGLHGTDNYLMVKRAKLFFALQAWANSRQTFRVDLRSYQAVDCPKAEDLPWSFFDPDHLPYSSFYVELTGYGAPDEHYGVLIAKSKELTTISGQNFPEVFLFYNGLVFNEYPTLELFKKFEQNQTIVQMEDFIDLTSAAKYATEINQEHASGVENGEIATNDGFLIPVDFTFAAALAVLQVVKTSSEEFILRQVREVMDGKRKKRDRFVTCEPRDISWFLSPRTVAKEVKSEVKVPLDQLIPPKDRIERKVKPPKGTRASPVQHQVRHHTRVYWCGPGGREPQVHWIEEFTRGVKPAGVTIPAEVIHEVKSRKPKCQDL